MIFTIIDSNILQALSSSRIKVMYGDYGPLSKLQFLYTCKLQCQCKAEKTKIQTI